jgi:hypothetical protein
VRIRRLSILAYPESRVWSTARCLEYDLMASGRTADLAVDSLLKMLRAHIDYDTRHHRPALSAFAPAPALYRHAFLNATGHWVFEADAWFVNGATPVVDVAMVAQNPAVRSFAAAAVKIA